MLLRNSAIAPALLALLAVAHAACAQQYPDPSRFEGEIQAFERQDAARLPPRGAIVLTGSSSIRLWKQAGEALAPLTVIPRGFGGSTMRELLHYIDRVAIAYQPRAIVIYEGDNDTDVSLAIPPESILGDLQKIIARVHAKLPGTRIYVLAVKPSVLRRAQWPVVQQVNAGYRKIADADPLVHYVDVATPLLGSDGRVRTDIFLADNLHLNDKGYALWGPAVRDALMPLEGSHE
jgi:lysophospholipase L1-like esterase